MIRVLQVVTTMNRAGLESRLMDIYRVIDRSIVQFDFYTARNVVGEYDEEIRGLGGRVFYSEPIRPGREWRKEREFKMFLLSHPEYRIVHSHVNEWSTIYLRAAKSVGVPTRIAHSRGANKTLELATIYKDIMRLPIKRYATDCFAVSREAGEHLFGRKAYSTGRVVVLPNAIDTEKYRFDAKRRQDMRGTLGIGEEPVVIHVGNLNPVKNHQFLLDVFRCVLEIVPTAKLLIVGDGPERARIESRITELGMDWSVLILGKRTDVPDLLMAADAFVFPSFHEGFPGAALEAVTSGLPVIASDTITRELAITQDVTFLSLKDSVKIWAKAVIDSLPMVRFDRASDVKAAGYDIQELSKALELYYTARGGMVLE